MASFPIFFFLFVEVPSMGAMLVHKAIMTATGRQTEPLNVWLYRLIGVTTGVVLLSLSFVIGAEAACLLFVLFVGGGLVALYQRRSRTPEATGPTGTPPAVGVTGTAAGIGPQALPGVLGEFSRRSLDDLRRVLGDPRNPEETDLHLRSADLMAALRFSQVAVDPGLPDQVLGDQLASDAPALMGHFIDAYGQLPASRERDVAVEILRAYRPPGRPVTGNVYTSYAGSALREARPNHA